MAHQVEACTGTSGLSCTPCFVGVMGGLEGPQASSMGSE